MKRVLLGLLILIVGFLVFVASRPSAYHVERSATIAAPGDVVFAKIDDFHQWEAWSPWEHLDPNMKRTFEGSASGVGSIYSWTGNDKVGEGRMTITESSPNDKVGIKLEFIKPWQQTCTASFALAPEGAGTKVTWSMDGNHNFVSKAMCVFMDMDKMIGGDFEKGLAGMKQVAEAAGQPAAADTTKS